MGLGIFGLLLAEVDRAVGYHASNKSLGTALAPTTTTTTPSRGHANGSRIGLASAIPVGGALAFTDEAQGIPAYCVQRPDGTFVAVSAIRTHAGCTVSFDKLSTEFLCPCHGSIYNALTGALDLDRAIWWCAIRNGLASVASLPEVPAAESSARHAAAAKRYRRPTRLASRCFQRGDIEFDRPQHRLQHSIGSLGVWVSHEFAKTIRDDLP